jgi:hypothetical protein
MSNLNDLVTQGDWYTISSQSDLTLEFLRKHKGKIVWREYCRANKALLTLDFIEEFADYLDWSLISDIPMPEDFIERHRGHVNWAVISEKQELSESFIIRYSFLIHWDKLSFSRKTRLSESFIKKYQFRLDWSGISETQKLSENFIIEFRDKVDWFEISRYQKLSESFIRRYIYLLVSSLVILYQNVSYDFFFDFQIS